MIRDQYFKTKAEVFSFLERKTPIPSSKSLSCGDSARYEELVDFLRDHKDERAVPFLLQTMNPESSLDVCDGVLELLAEYPQEHVWKQLTEILESNDHPALTWVLRYCADHPRPECVDYLRRILRNPQSSKECVQIAASALRSIVAAYDNTDAKTILQKDYYENDMWGSLREIEARSTAALEEILSARLLKDTIAEADTAFRLRQYNSVVKLLQPLENVLPLTSLTKLQIAKKKIAKI
jgi:hypothetical protein